MFADDLTGSAFRAANSSRQSGRPGKPIPCDIDGEEHDARHASPEAEARPTCVLVVDDYRDNAESTAILLRLFGCTADTAYSGPEAIEMAVTERPDLVLLDIAMPGMCGFEVAIQLRRVLGSSVMLVALSAFEAQDSPRKFTDAGFNDHLVKPAEPEALQELLSLLERHRQS